MAERVLITKTPDGKGESTNSRLQKTKDIRSIKSSALQAKLRIGQPNDICEHEADHVAEQVIRMPDPVLQRSYPKYDVDDKKVLQTKELAGKTPLTQGQDVPPIVQDVLNSPGQPLDSATRAYMEPRFGYDFSRVRVHTDEKAAESAQAVNALAYTVGHDVVFGTGQWQSAPKISVPRQRLLAHELTHVVQMQSSSHQIIKPEEYLEHEGVVAGSKVVTNLPLILGSGLPRRGILRVAADPAVPVRPVITIARRVGHSSPNQVADVRAVQDRLLELRYLSSADHMREAPTATATGSVPEASLTATIAAIRALQIDVSNNPPSYKDPKGMQECPAYETITCSNPNSEKCKEATTELEQRKEVCRVKDYMDDLGKKVSPLITRGEVESAIKEIQIEEKTLVMGENVTTTKLAYKQHMQNLEQQKMLRALEAAASNPGAGAAAIFNSDPDAIQFYGAAFDVVAAAGGGRGLGEDTKLAPETDYSFSLPPAPGNAGGGRGLGEDTKLAPETDYSFSLPPAPGKTGPTKIKPNIPFLGKLKQSKQEQHTYCGHQVHKKPGKSQMQNIKNNERVNRLAREAEVGDGYPSIFNEKYSDPTLSSEIKALGNIEIEAGRVTALQKGGFRIKLDMQEPVGWSSEKPTNILEIRLDTKGNWHYYPSK
jgi:Domain of unknown function (DUF4157)